MDKPKFQAVILVAVVCALMALPARADSQVRIVRLSDVQGGVQIDKNAGLGFENAFLNLPVTQGTQVRTGDKGRAEIEFEDGSTLRLTPDTTIQFSNLGASDAGKRTSEVNLVRGRAYVNWLGKSGDSFTLNFSQERVELTQSAHFRVASFSNAVEVASFKNEIHVEGPAGAVNVEKRKMVAFDSDQPTSSVEAKKLIESPYDEWDKQSASYHDEYAKNNPTPYGYGMSDLNYYGAYNKVPGFGTLWQPFFAGAGWNPYMDGAWSWYPGMGFMWASAYPWGWMPYYYGNWIYAQGFGWGWQPGGFSAWHGGIHYTGAVAGFQAPAVPKGTVSTVVVGRGTTLAPLSPLRSVVNNGTAGLGITRGSVGNLHQVNSLVARTGWAQLQPAPQYSASSSRAGGYGASNGRESSVGPATHASPMPSGHPAGGTVAPHR